VIKTGGGHFGWPYREATQGYATTQCTSTTPSSTCLDPAYVCNHTGATTASCLSITGGVIIDACDWPASLRNRYYFGDWMHSWVGSLAVNANRDGLGQGTHTPVLTIAGQAGPTHFEVGPEGALYFATYADGLISRIRPKAPVACE
jgi:glucose/arabinose dehydrogenase